MQHTYRERWREIEGEREAARICRSAPIWQSGIQLSAFASVQKKNGKRKQENETETETDRQEMLYKCSWPGAVAGRLAGVAVTARSTCCLGGLAWWCWRWCLILVGVFDRVPNAFGVA